MNFGATNGGVTVSSSGLSGYAWSANDGWINLAPTQGGVHNDGTGVLSGFAWDETAGYVNFSGVTIDSSGKFHGSAVGGTVGTTSYAINFDCANCGVVTTWRPVATTTQNQNTVTPVTSGVRSGQSVSVTIPTNAVSSGIAAANAAAQKTVGTILDTTKSLLDSLTQITVTATSSAATSSPTTTSPSLEARLLSALEELLSLIPQIFARILPK
ncbi:MAG: hypothetical protein P4M11_05955 [Candidatus Pacebacteria bacterium]|nr:hypothetical protein [Candidatus Paceibacterota bacterium]